MASAEFTAPQGQIPASLWVFYHYLYPDTVVSAVLMDQLCQGFHQRGWKVTGISGNRSSRDESPYPVGDQHLGVQIRRIWRPRFRQSSSLGRLFNAAWMIAAWSLLALEGETPDAIVIGTDPILSVLIAIFWKCFSPETRIVHWCFDLYPEAAYADGLLSPSGSIARWLTSAVRYAYRHCDAIVDIGPCMREKLAVYRSPARVETVVPWALEEPDDVLKPATQERLQIFGQAKLAMLYSGSFGRAHAWEDFLALAKVVAGKSACLAFSVRGNREQELRAAVAELPPGSTCAIHFVPFASAASLLDRLAAPDIHLLSLAPQWAGLVVPSKFFGALAVGRPVLFSGSPASSIARWIVEYGLGWVLTPETFSSVATDLLDYAEDPQRVEAMQRRCLATYQAHFSRKSGLDRMHALLHDLTVPQNR
jgi:colanic acid biosynthesis glycosyl transferase WcaI